MNERSKTGIEILQASILLGLMGDVLLRATPWGLNVFLFVGTLAAAIVMLFRRRGPAVWNSNTIALISAMTFFGACFLWRDSIELRVFDSFAVIIIAALLVLPTLKIEVQHAGVFNYALALLWSGFSAAFAPFLLLFNDIEGAAVSKAGWRKHFVAVLRGVAIATPLLFIFGALFVAADAMFEGFIEKTLKIEPDIILQHLFLILFFGWLSAGYLRAIVTATFAEDAKDMLLVAEDPKQPESSVTETTEEPTAKNEPAPESWSWRQPDNSFLPNGLTLGSVEIGVSMGLINALFLAFVVFQIPYLFGGFELVQQTENLKLADYARRGFGELVTVAALVLPILLFSHWLIRKDSPAAEKIYRVMAGIQVALLFVIMASAAQRLFVLTGNLGYGLTTVRFYPMVFMIWLAIVFIWFSATVLRGARARFAWGALWSAIGVLAILHFVNPDGYIVRTNIRLMQQGRPFDGHYNARLSADSVPAMLEAFPEIANETEFFENRERFFVKRQLMWRYCRLIEGSDVRTWNYSRWQAKRVFDQNANWAETTNNCAGLSDSD